MQRIAQYIQSALSILDDYLSSHSSVHLMNIKILMQGLHSIIIQKSSNLTLSDILNSTIQIESLLKQCSIDQQSKQICSEVFVILKQIQMQCEQTDTNQVKKPFSHAKTEDQQAKLDQNLIFLKLVDEKYQPLVQSQQKQIDELKLLTQVQRRSLLEMSDLLQQMLHKVQDLEKNNYSVENNSTNQQIQQQQQQKMNQLSNIQVKNDVTKVDNKQVNNNNFDTHINKSSARQYLLQSINAPEVDVTAEKHVSKQSKTASMSSHVLQTKYGGIKTDKHVQIPILKSGVDYIALEQQLLSKSEVSVLNSNVKSRINVKTPIKKFAPTLDNIK